MLEAKRYSYRRTLPHLQKDSRPLFVTFASHNRWQMPGTARRIVLDCCLFQHGRRIDLHAAVVMPDHVHLIFSSLVDADGWPCCLPEIMHAIKGESAHLINQALNRRGPVWQDEFFDHVLRCNESLAEKVDYICQNPVRAGLVQYEADYPWLWKGRIPTI